MSLCGDTSYHNINKPKMARISNESRALEARTNRK